MMGTKLWVKDHLASSRNSKEVAWLEWNEGREKQQDLREVTGRPLLDFFFFGCVGSLLGRVGFF